MTDLIFDGLVMTESPNGRQIQGFESGKTQARIVFDRRGERVEIICVTEDLACVQLSSVGALGGWKLVSASLEPYQCRFPIASTEGETARRTR